MFEWDVSKVHEKKNFISKSETDIIISYAEKIASKDKYSDVIGEYGRVVFPFLGIKDKEVKDIMVDLEKRAYSFIIGEYATSHQLRVTRLNWKRDIEIVRWTSGGLQGHRDGHEEMPKEDNKLKLGLPISSLVYLTEDFDGGELYFEDFDYEFKPSAGSLCMFPSFYMHQVTNIFPHEGSVGRYTLPFFHGFDVREYDEKFLEEPNHGGYEYGNKSFDEIVLHK
jgi:hypothetical protein